MTDKWGRRFFKAGGVMLVIMGLVHSLSLFQKMVPANDTERQLIDLMTSYRFNLMGTMRSMMEGVVSLMQLAKVSAALGRLDEARVPFISLLTDPTTGGVTASYAMLGDLNIAEPGALIGFAGPRVIEQTIRQKLPEGFQTAEFLLEHGFLDAVVPRKELKPYIGQALEFFLG